MTADFTSPKMRNRRSYRSSYVWTTAGIVLTSLMLCAISIDSAWSQSSPRPERVPPTEQSRKSRPEPKKEKKAPPRRVAHGSENMIEQGRQIFRYDTFGDEAFWGETLRLHEAVAKLPPSKALELGLKVDAEALPSDVVQQLKAGKLNLNDPAVTLTLLKLNAVVGVTGHLDPTGKHLASIGIQCALCHSTVDDSAAPGIGRRLDGWPNRDLNVGAIVASVPDLSFFTKLFQLPPEKVREVLMAWGPGKFDAILVLDGKGFRPDGKTAAVLLPPAYGLTGVNLHTWTGWGSVPYWNAFVANIEMRGKGVFHDSRLNDKKFPISSAHPETFGEKKDETDLITPKLAALHMYQLSLTPPVPPKGTFDPAAADRGRQLFNGKARCASCHVPPIFTDPGFNMHTPEEIGIDSFQADRSPSQRAMYRTAPLGGLWARQKGGFYHDGRFPTLLDVINHYIPVLKTELSDAEKQELVQYLLSLPTEP